MTQWKESRSLRARVLNPLPAPAPTPSSSRGGGSQGPTGQSIQLKEQASRSERGSVAKRWELEMVLWSRPLSALAEDQGLVPTLGISQLPATLVPE